jgi:hypothetical protein
MAYKQKKHSVENKPFDLIFIVVFDRPYGGESMRPFKDKLKACQYLVEKVYSENIDGHIDVFDESYPLFEITLAGAKLYIEQNNM